VKYSYVMVKDDDLASGIDELLDALEPSDLERLSASVERLSSFRAMLGGPAARPTKPAIGGADEVNELERHLMALETKVAEQGELLNKVTEEVLAVRHALDSVLLAAADRIAAQAELLAKRAEAAPVATVAEPVLPFDMDPGVEVRDDAEADLGPTCGSCPALLHDPESVTLGRCFGCRQPGPTMRVEVPPADPVTEEMAAAYAKATAPDPAAELSIAERARRRRLGIARFITNNGPTRAITLCERLDIPFGSITSLLCHEWFEKAGDRKQAPWTLTHAGCAAVTADGHVPTPAAEAKPAEPETKAPEPEAPRPEAKPPRAETPPARTESLEGVERVRAQVKLIAEAIAASAEPLLSDEIARRAGLPVDVVNKRLNRYGPSSLGGLRYFFKSEKHPGCWRLSNSGQELVAKEGAQQA
jgi:uncharacterized coiled-coil protein SlyX